VDVRNVALAHILSLETPKAANQRIFLVSELITPQLVVNIIREQFPQLHDRILEGNPRQILPKQVLPTGWDTKSFEVFGGGWGYQRLEESLVDTMRCILDLEKQWKCRVCNFGSLCSIENVPRSVKFQKMAAMSIICFSDAVVLRNGRVVTLKHASCYWSRKS
jgi:hypothetical protein